ncbi:hypothetical protein Gpo141_00003828 [Globisporangium polare]
MTSSAIVRRAAAENQGVVVRVWRWVKATLLRVLFGQTEWHRICAPMGNRVDEQDRMVRFRTSLALSSALVSTSNAVFDFEAFPMDTTLSDMTKRLKLGTKNITLITNLRSCLHRCNFVNRVYARVHNLRDEAYSSANTKHEEMLEQLWSNLKPNVRRAGGRITKEWGEIGFQGTDPMSDFRGMGVLSLVQLNHFSAKYPVEAQAALAESNHPTRWYPFSVTGINITGFMIELVRDRLVDFKLYSKAKDEAAREDNVEQGVLALHELYCTLFTRFNKLWVDSNPRDVMAFPTIFQSLKDSVRRELTQRSFKY